MPVTQTWIQNYNPLGNALLSTLAAAVPVCLLFYLLAVRRTQAWRAAVYAFLVSIALAIFVFGMPARMAAGAVGHGLLYAFVRIIWTLIAAVFVYELTVETGHFEKIKQSIGGITADRRLQVLLIAFAFGSVLEGAGGAGAPVAVAGSMMIGLGFRPFEAAMLCLIANTAPVAWGGMGNPVRTLVAVTGLNEYEIGATIGRILPWTVLILPFWIVRTQVKTRAALQVWPGLAACGVTFAAIQFFWSNFVDSTLVDIVAGMGTLVVLGVFFRVWKPKEVWRYPGEPPAKAGNAYSRLEVLHAWSPFLILAVFVVIWGLPGVSRALDSLSVKQPVPGLHQAVIRTPPVVDVQRAEPAIFDFAWLSAVGTATFFAGLIAGPILGLSLRRTLLVFWRTVMRMRTSIAAIMAMLGLGFVTRYSGMDAVLGLAFTHTGVLFPVFGTLIGWLGVTLSGTDAGSNALFGSLQVITANKLGISPVLMAAANSAGGVMGKMINAQSITVACAATKQEGKEGDLFRALLVHSILLTLIIGGIVTFYAYAAPGWLPRAGR